MVEASRRDKSWPASSVSSTSTRTDLGGQTLSILTVNIGEASRERAEAMLRWLAARPELVLILTETSSGAGSAYVLDRFRRAGNVVVHTPGDNSDRGTAIVSRVAIAEPLSGRFAGVTIPSRVAAAVLDTE